MRSLKIAIIDDEENARNTLSDLLHLYFERKYTLIYAHSVMSGLKLLKKEKPDILLLDIQMDDGTGFELLELLEGAIYYPVIFTTAYDNYALRAFKYYAIDYLLKPIIADDLLFALERAIKQIGNSELNIPAKSLTDSYKQKDQDSFVFNTQKELRKVKLSNIAYLTAESNFCFVYLLDGKKLAVSSTLKDYEMLLPSSKFFRTHKSYLINLDCVEAYVKKDGGYILLRSKLEVPLSKRNKQAFLKHMKSG